MLNPGMFTLYSDMMTSLFSHGSATLGDPVRIYDFFDGRKTDRNDTMGHHRKVTWMVS